LTIVGEPPEVRSQLCSSDNVFRRNERCACDISAIVATPTTTDGGGKQEDGRAIGGHVPRPDALGHRGGGA